MTPRLALLSLLAASALLAPSRALANGRFPASTQMVFHPTDPDQHLIRVTFGLLMTHDGGNSYSWVCERAVGYGGIQDPAVGLTDNGTILVAAFEGLATSSDEGCSFAFLPEASKEFVIDVAVDRGSPQSAVAVTSTGQGGLSFNVRVLETSDSGKSWQFIGSPVDPSVLAETIDPAPSRKERLYVSGFTSQIIGEQQVRTGAFVVSDDRGKTWKLKPFDLEGDKSLFIAAVDPANPDRVYLRTKGAVNDRLVRTDDAGETFVTLTSVEGSLLGFALSPDGQKIAIGGPKAGVLVADTQSFSFQKVASFETSCLAWNPRGLHACANAFVDGFSVGYSSDDGKSWLPLLSSFNTLTGPLCGCSTEPSPATTCAQEWAQLKTTLGIDGGPAGCSPGQAGSGSGGSGSAGSGAGAATAGSSGQASPGSGGSATAAPPSGSSCDCGPGLAPSGPGAAAALASLLLLRARRRARR